ncbi:MAG TPA: hypothetical protein EYG51_15105 [Pseudomonadales bacterium]|nr:hypothetical protein [Pseudomonadales bacterium]
MRRSKKVRKLTPQMLRRLVLSERRRIRETSDPIAAGIEDVEKVSADEVDADKFADTLEKDIDHLKVLKIQERKLFRTLKKVNSAKKRIKRRLLRKI